MALAGFGLGMVSFYFESYLQEHQKWPQPAWGPEWPVSITNMISRNTKSGFGRPGARNGQLLIKGHTSRSTRSGSGQTGVRPGHFLIRGAHEQEHQNWLCPDRGITTMSITSCISIITSTTSTITTTTTLRSLFLLLWLLLILLPQPTIIITSGHHDNEEHGHHKYSSQEELHNEKGGEGG